MIRIGKFRIGKDYVFTFITEFAVLLAGVLVYKFAAVALGETGFSEYSLARRTMSFIHPVLILGLGVGIPRYLAFNATDKEKSDTYFVSGLLVLGAATAAALLVLNLFSHWFAYLLFGFPEYSYLIAPISVMLVGMVVHSACYSYFRGKVMMVPANLLQFLNLGIVPVAVFLAEHDLERVLYFTGFTWIAVAGIFLSIVLLRVKAKRHLLWSCAKELVHYGIQRTPGDLGISGFFALPAYITVHLTNDIKVGGYVAFGVSLLNMAGAAFGPICLILLPRASQLIVNKEFGMLRAYTDKIFWITLLLTLGGLILFEPLAAQFIRIYLGESFDQLVFIVRVVMLGSVGYTVYISLRSILDAYHVKAVNTRNIFFAFIFFAVSSGVLLLIYRDHLLVLYTFTLSMLLLGGLTFYETKKVLKKAELV